MGAGAQDPSSPVSPAGSGKSVGFNGDVEVKVSDAELDAVMSTDDADAVHHDRARAETLQLQSQASKLKRLTSGVEADASLQLTKNRDWKSLRRSVQLNMVLQDDVEEMRSMVGSIFQGDPFEIDLEVHEEDIVEGFVVLPKSQFRTWWDLVQVPMLLYVMFSVPVRFGFNLVSEPGTALFWWEVLVDIYFIADCGLNFFMAYHDTQTNELVTERKLIRRHYLKGWFAVDFASILPIDHINRLTGNENSDAGTKTKALKILRMVRLTKLLRIARLKRLVRKHAETIDGLATGFKLFGTMLVVAFCAHIVACSWYYVGDDPSGWVAAVFSDEQTCDEKTTMCLANLSIGDKYLVSAWFALAVLLAPTYAPGIEPVTMGEIGFMMFLTVVGVIVTASIIGAVSSTVVNQNLLEAKVTRQLAELREFLVEQKLPRELTGKIRRYMEQLYRQKTGYDVQEVMSSLPPGLKAEMLDHMYSNIVSKIPLFKGCSNAAIQMVCIAMKPYPVLSGEIVCKEGEKAEAMFVVEEGGIVLQRFGVILGQLTTRSFFGHEGLLPGQHVREHTAIARRDSQLAFLTQGDMKSVIMEHPEVLHQLRECGRRRAKHESDRLNRLITESAKTLGVDEHSDVMEDVLSAVTVMCSDENEGLEEMEAQIHAAKMIQRVYRGRQGRKKAAFIRNTNTHKAARKARALRLVAKVPAGTRQDLHEEIQQGASVGMLVPGSLKRSSSRAKISVQQRQAEADALYVSPQASTDGYDDMVREAAGDLVVGLAAMATNGEQKSAAATPIPHGIAQGPYASSAEPWRAADIAQARQIEMQTLRDTIANAPTQQVKALAEQKMMELLATPAQSHLLYGP